MSALSVQGQATQSDVASSPSVEQSAPPAITRKYALADNAYRFLNQSLRHSRATASDVGEWAFALFHLTQSIELLLKEVLRQHHEVLIYEDIDHPRTTVSLPRAVQRFESIADSTIPEREKRLLTKAVELRNRIVHHW